MLAVTPGPVHAQDELANLREQVQRLRQELADMQFRLFSGAQPSVSGVTGGTAAAQTAVRVAELENSLRQVTGQLEQANFQLNQLSQRLRDMQQGVDQRLGEMDRKIAAMDQELRRRPAPRPGGTQQLTVPSGPGSVSRQDAASVPQTVGPVGEVDRAEPRSAAIDPTQVLPAGTPQQQYNHAFRLLRQGDYTEAERALTAFLQLHQDNTLSSSAMYWLGETHYVRNDFVMAAQLFSQTYQDEPRGPKAPDSLLKLGMSLNNIGETGTACTTFQELARRFPDAPSNIKLLADRERQKAGCN